MRRIVAKAFPRRDDDPLADVPDVAEDICRRCRGDGMIGQDVCPECEGTGRVVKAVGGG